MDSTTPAAHRVRSFLEREPIVWLSTSRPDGGPHLVPTWFAWDGETIVIGSKPEARMHVHPDVATGGGARAG